LTEVIDGAYGSMQIATPQYDNSYIKQASSNRKYDNIIPDLIKRSLFPFPTFSFVVLTGHRKIDIFHSACSACAGLKNPHREYPNIPTVLKNQYKHRGVGLVAISEWIPFLPRKMQGC
ncbi:hypothetical protein EZS27_044498, partial [termite gut metagenome]